MIEPFKISVIIPVYNRNTYIKKSIQSAIDLEETGEVIVIDDGSTDGTLETLLSLKKRFNKLKVLQHPDKKNHGVSATRNLGILNASYQYIAFLDSDDYYLPHRFKFDKEILSNNPNIDGVYNALGIEYYSENGKKMFIQAGYKYQEFLTVSGDVPPNELFLVLFNEHPLYKGAFSGITLTVRKNLFLKSGYFPSNLKQKEDNHLWQRMAAVGKLVSGNITDAVAIRGIHDANTMTDLTIQPEADKIWWKDLNTWMKKNNTNEKYMQCFRQNYLYYKIHNCNKIVSIYSFLAYFVRYTSLIKKQYGCFDIYFFNLFGESKLTTYLIYAKNKLLKN